MITLILLILILLWLFGYSPFQLFPLPNLVLFHGARDITLWDLLVFGVILWLIGLLPRPFREVAIVALILWVVSSLGLIAISGFSNILILVLIVALIVYIFQQRRV